MGSAIISSSLHLWGYEGTLRGVEHVDAVSLSVASDGDLSGGWHHQLKVVEAVLFDSHLGGGVPELAHEFAVVALVEALANLHFIAGAA